MGFGLDGKTVVVTGAARGLGREYALKLAGEGARVVVGDLRDCGETLAAIRQAGGEAVGGELDVTDGASCQALADLAVESFGSLHGLVNNAALYGDLEGGRFKDIPETEWDRCMTVNVKGIWNCCKAVVSALRQAGGGSIVNVASLAAVYGMPYALHYSTSKGAVIGFTRSLARELGCDNIRVNAIAPSAVMTEGTNEFFGDKAEQAKKVIAGGQALQKSLEPEDIAGTVLYLLGDASKFVTGQTLMVDGGTVFL